MNHDYEIIVKMLEDVHAEFESYYCAVHFKEDKQCVRCQRHIPTGMYAGTFLMKDELNTPINKHQYVWCAVCDSEEPFSVSYDVNEQYKKLMHRKQRLEKIKDVTHV